MARTTSSSSVAKGKALDGTVARASSDSVARKAVKQTTAARKRQLDEKRATAGTGGKLRLNMVVIGHVDAGKSTIMGHLLYQLGHVTQRQMHKYEDTAAC